MQGAGGTRQAIEGLPKTQTALDYACRMHAGQARKADGAPFILHPREVAQLLYRAGAPDHLIAAGALHDVIEKTQAAPSDLRRRFGWRVAVLVLAVSEDKRIADYQARKAALRQQVADAGDEALMLMAADKISKARELRIEDARASESAGERPTRARRLEHYRRCLSLLQGRLPESPLVEQLDAELEDLSGHTLGQPVAIG